MSNFSEGHFTRGGQMTLHGFRMWSNVMRFVLRAAFILFLGVSLGLSWWLTTPYERYILSEYAVASVIAFPFPSPSATVTVTLPQGQQVKFSKADFDRSLGFQKMCKEIERKILLALKLGGVSAGLLMGSAYWIFRRRSRAKTQHAYLQGDRLAPEAAVRKMLYKRGGPFSGLFLGSLPLPDGMECSHFLFHGTTGTGKSTAIKALLDQIRRRGDRAIIYDKSCNYLEEFYRPGSDILLNPLDQRSESWDLWAECRDMADFDGLAAAQIPMPLGAHDPFWVSAARIIFAAVACEMQKDSSRSALKLLHFLLNADSDCLQHYLKGTEAEPLVSSKMEKVAASIKSVLATYLRSLKYLSQSGHPFSIRRWVGEEQGKQWLFITSLGDRHETLKPLISCWLDTAVNALLSLPPNSHRRIWIILDELTSLQPLPYLTQALSEARKFGGCIVVGIQSYAQLCKVYGSEGAREISGLLNTRVIFRQPDPELAQWSALNLGETLRDEFHEGFSYSLRAGSEGVSTHRAQTRKPVVGFSDIIQLPNLKAYVRLPENYPVTQVTFHPQKRMRVNTGFLRVTSQASSVREVDNLLDAYATES